MNTKTRSESEERRIQLDKENEEKNKNDNANKPDNEKIYHLTDIRPSKNEPEKEESNQERRKNSLQSSINDQSQTKLFQTEAEQLAKLNAIERLKRESTIQKEIKNNNNKVIDRVIKTGGKARNSVSSIVEVDVSRDKSIKNLEKGCLSHGDSVKLGKEE